MSFIVAIDGPAGTGKGTITKLIAEDFGLVSFDTGAMYRCASLYIIRNNIMIEDIEAIKQMLSTIKIEIKFEQNEQVFYLNGENVSNLLRSKEVNDIVSPVSHIPEVRSHMVYLQRQMAASKNVIMEGRDIGTNVFPNADVKIYLDASSAERANRRLKQNIEQGITDISYEEILQNIQFRDENDKTSDVAPLKKAKDAILIDSTNMTIEEVKNRVKEIIEAKLKEKGIVLKQNAKQESQNISKQISKFAGSKEFDHPTDSWFKKLQRRFVWHVLRGFYKLVYRIKINGQENVPQEGAFIICGNHVDFVKVPVIVLFTPRKINFIAKAELFKNPILAWLGRLFDVISVKRGKQDIDSMKNSLKVLSKGEGLGLFPEGTRNGIAKKVKVKNGAAFMALRTGKPIVPVGIKVTKAPFSKIILNFGKPLDYSQYQSKTPEKEVLDKVTQELMDTIIDLTNQ